MEKQGRKEYFEENREEICKLKQDDAPTIVIFFKS